MLTVTHSNTHTHRHTQTHTHARTHTHTHTRAYAHKNIKTLTCTSAHTPYTHTCTELGYMYFNSNENNLIIRLISKIYNYLIKRVKKVTAKLSYYCFTSDIHILYHNYITSDIHILYYNYIISDIHILYHNYITSDIHILHCIIEEFLL